MQFFIPPMCDVANTWTLGHEADLVLIQGDPPKTLAK